MKFILEKIKKLSELDPTQKHEWILHLIEECGEVSQCISVDLGLKNKKLTENTKEELVDVIVIALATYFQYGGSNKHLNDYALKKINRWKNHLVEQKKK